MSYYSKSPNLIDRTIEDIWNFFDDIPVDLRHRPSVQQRGAELHTIAEFDAWALEIAAKRDAQKPDFGTENADPHMIQTPAVQGVPAVSVYKALVYTTTNPLTSPAIPAILPTPTITDLDASASYRPLTTVKHKLASFRGRGRHGPNRKLGDFIPFRLRWDGLSPEERSAATFLYASLADGAFAFSLRFNDSRREKLCCSDDPARDLSKRIGRLMRENIGKTLPFAFVFEFSPAKNVLHVHGVVIGDGIDAKIIRLIFKRAAGVIHGPAGGTQLDLRALHDWKWRNYCLDDAERTRELLGTGKIEFASAELKAAARSYNDQQRETRKLAKKSSKNINKSQSSVT